MNTTQQDEKRQRNLEKNRLAGNTDRSILHVGLLTELLQHKDVDKRKKMNNRKCVNKSIFYNFKTIHYSLQCEI